jgi:hypothetical protein
MIIEDVELPSIPTGTFRITVIGSAGEPYSFGLVVVPKPEDFDGEVERAVERWRIDNPDCDRTGIPSILN